MPLDTRKPAMDKEPAFRKGKRVRYARRAFLSPTLKLPPGITYCDPDRILPLGAVGDIVDTDMSGTRARFEGDDEPFRWFDPVNALVCLEPVEDER